VRGVRKQFFFEKKNQKTFAIAPAQRLAIAPTDKSLLGLFFGKEHFF
jgi:hypothetical protein